MSTGQQLFEYCSQLKKSLEMVTRILDSSSENQKLSDLSYDELDDMLYRLEKDSLSCRYFIGKKTVPKNITNDGSFYKKNSCFNNDFYMSKYPNNMYDDIQATFQNGVILVKTPLTFKRMKRQNSVKENYILIKYIEEKVRNCIKNNYSEILKLQRPFTVIMKRKYVSYHQRLICDNDNMENGRVINAIFDALNRSDNVQEMDVISCARKVETAEEEGMEFYAFPSCDLEKHLDLLKHKLTF